MLLTVVGIFAIAIFFDRHPIRLRELGRPGRGAGRPAYPGRRPGPGRASRA
jgi:hypothetical protein